MKYNILNILFFIFATALFVGCQEDYEDTEVESPSYDDEYSIRFIDDNSTDVLLNNSIQSFSLTVIRDNEEDALEVPVIVVTNENSVFDIPGSVSFAAGEDSVSITISMADTATYDVAYALELEFDDEYYQNPYNSEFNTYSGEVTLLNVCALDSISDLEGSWTGDDSYWDADVTTTVSGDDLAFSGLSEGMMEDWWGETITERYIVTMDIDMDYGLIDIARQDIYTTDYNGDAYLYEIEGYGKWDNCGDSPTLTIYYDIYYDGEDTGIAATYGDDYLGGISYFTATLSFSDLEPSSVLKSSKIEGIDYSILELKNR